MDLISSIPDYPNLPLPAPVWLLETGLVISLFFHLLPMNIALGGGFYSAFLMLFCKKDPHLSRFAKTLAGSLPIFTSIAITLGLLPLILMQLLYGSLFYKSSIELEVPWLSVIVSILIAYSLLYIYRFEETKLSKLSPWILIAANVLILSIAAIFTENMIHMMPGADAQLIPRTLHFIVSGFAVTGLAATCFGLYYHKSDPAYSKTLIQSGSLVFLVITFLQIFVGAWFLLSIPRETMLNFMGRDLIGSIGFMGSMLFMVFALIAALFAAFKASPLATWLMNIFSGILIFLMVLMRHALRKYLIVDLIDPSQLNVTNQGSWIAFYAVAALATVVYLIWLSRLIINIKR